jgi:2-oxo-3-hexenedioate decarboxylase
MNDLDPVPDAVAVLLDACDRGATLAPRSCPRPASLADAEAIQARINLIRQARGERRLGFKIGFTNRSIWPVYGVHHPIWAPVWDSTLTLLDGTQAEARVARFTQPRLEPEIVFGLARSPSSADPDEVFGAIEWIAHGFEVVQCPYPDWKFDAAQAIAAQSLHGALLVGPRLAKSVVPGWQALASIELNLDCDGRSVARGAARLVLDNPLLALCHLVAELERRGERIAPGAVVTTGTLTDAQPLAPGQRWETRLSGIDLPGLVLSTC